MPRTNGSQPPKPRIVLALNGGPTDELVTKLGCRLGMVDKAELVAIHVVEVDWSQDLQADVASGDETASAVLDMAEGIAERLHLPLGAQLLQARDVGAALVDEATELGAEMIIMGLAYRKKFGGDFAIGRTVPYVLQNAPCQVIVVREPIATGEARGEQQTSVGAGVGAADRL
jgi:nucleotide-binding universal stress UspA family protein